MARFDGGAGVSVFIMPKRHERSQHAMRLVRGGPDPSNTGRGYSALDESLGIKETTGVSPDMSITE